MYKITRTSGPFGPVFFRKHAAKPGCVPHSRSRKYQVAGNWLVRAAQTASAAVTIAALVPLTASAQQALLPTTQLKINNVTVQAEVAATETSRSYGLMNRVSLPENQGMLFVFDQVATPCFWMKNTPLPLSIAFIDPQGKITNIADMQPLSLDAHCPTAPVRYALEMEQGWFAGQHIKAGDTVENLP